jgi:hypothetical protein
VIISGFEECEGDYAAFTLLKSGYLRLCLSIALSEGENPDVARTA